MSPQTLAIPDSMSSDTSVGISDGVRLECSPQLNHSINLSLLYGPHALCTQSFPPPTPPATVSKGTMKFLAPNLIDASLEIEVDFPEGEVTASAGHIKTYNRQTKDWCTVLAADDELLMRFAPCGGL